MNQRLGGSGSLDTLESIPVKALPKPTAVAPWDLATEAVADHGVSTLGNQISHGEPKFRKDADR